MTLTSSHLTVDSTADEEDEEDKRGEEDDSASVTFASHTTIGGEGEQIEDDEEEGCFGFCVSLLLEHVVVSQVDVVHVTLLVVVPVVEDDMAASNELRVEFLPEVSPSVLSSFLSSFVLHTIPFSTVDVESSC